MTPISILAFVANNNNNSPQPGQAVGSIGIVNQPVAAGVNPNAGLFAGAQSGNVNLSINGAAAAVLAALPAGAAVQIVIRDAPGPVTDAAVPRTTPA